MISLYALLATVEFWVLFLAYCAIMASRRSGKFQLTPWPVRALSYAVLGVLGVVDIVFNFTAGSLLFREMPDTFTFTQRCAEHLHDDDRRGRIARWFCDGWLNPFEENHCQ